MVGARLKSILGHSRIIPWQARHFKRKVRRVGRKPKFLIVDRFLCGPGNHHFEYAFHFGDAARQAGFEVHVAGSRLMDARRWPKPWCTVHAVFPRGLYAAKDWGGLLPASPAKPAKDSFWKRIHDRWLRYRWLRDVKVFQDNLHKLLQEVRVEDGDHVFLPTVCWCDLLGLVEVLKARPETVRANWHLQFHFELPTGPGADVWQKCIQQNLDRWLSGLGRHRLFFYCTTRQMVEHYQALGVAVFSEIPYPVRTAPAVDRPANRPLVLCCAGHARRDKGRAILPELIDQLWSDVFQPGLAQLYLQGGRRKFRNLSAIWLRHPTAIRFLPHPLETSDYVRVIASADIGLLLYDQTTFRRRCSGVLVEMLAAGVPVVVPANTWLSEQLPVELDASDEPTRLKNRLNHMAALPQNGPTGTMSQAPRGRVGLVAASPEEFASAVKEIIAHYAHYRKTAVTFAQSWSRVHSPENALRVLLARSAAAH